MRLRDKNGWLKLHRQIMDSEFYKEQRKFSKSEAWIDILLRTYHEDTVDTYKKKPIEIKKGTFPTSYGELAKAWDWNKKAVYQFINYLIKLKMLSIESNDFGNEKVTKKTTVVTVENWEFYQGGVTAKTTKKTTKLETKSEFFPILKEEKNIYSELLNFWNQQGIIKHAELNPEIVKAIDKISATLSLEQIKLCIERYRTVLKDESFFFSYQWSLVDFLNRRNGIKDFLDDGTKWVSYQNFINQQEPSKKAPNPYAPKCPEWL